MDDALSITLRRQLRRYLSRQMSLKQFVRWMAPRMATTKSTFADDLSNEVYLRLAEFTNGDWTEAEFGQILAFE